MIHRGSRSEHRCWSGHPSQPHPCQQGETQGSVLKQQKRSETQGLERLGEQDIFCVSWVAIPDRGRLAVQCLLHLPVTGVGTPFCRALYSLFSFSVILLPHVLGSSIGFQSAIASAGPWHWCKHKLNLADLSPVCSSQCYPTNRRINFMGKLNTSFLDLIRTWLNLSIFCSWNVNAFKRKKKIPINESDNTTEILFPWCGQSCWPEPWLVFTQTC